MLLPLVSVHNNFNELALLICKKSYYEIHCNKTWFAEVNNGLCLDTCHKWENTDEMSCLVWFLTVYRLCLFQEHNHLYLFRPTGGILRNLRITPNQEKLWFHLCSEELTDIGLAYNEEHPNIAIYTIRVFLSVQGSKHISMQNPPQALSVSPL